MMCATQMANNIKIDQDLIDIEIEKDTLVYTLKFVSLFPELNASRLLRKMRKMHTLEKVRLVLRDLEEMGLVISYNGRRGHGCQVFKITEDGIKYLDNFRKSITEKVNPLNSIFVNPYRNLKTSAEASIICNYSQSQFELITRALNIRNKRYKKVIYFSEEDIEKIKAYALTERVNSPDIESNKLKNENIELRNKIQELELKLSKITEATLMLNNVIKLNLS
jgi:DNA-binding PadR family transcriptional regulator